MANNLKRLNPFTHYDLVEETWTSLEKNAQVSFFNSWGWVSTWLNCLPENTNIEFIVSYDDHQPVCCFFLGIKSAFEHKIFYKKRGYLNSTGLSEYDEIVIEYNNILCNKRHNHQLSEIFLRLSDIEEFRLPITYNLELTNSAGFYTRQIDRLSYWIDLTKFSSADEYLKLLSKNKRQQIKRSIKAYGGEESIQLHFASSVTEALTMLSRLEKLHQKEWQSRGKNGAFSRPFFKKFHRTLIRARFATGEIQLVKIHTANEEIGYLYNFVFNQQVLFYQSGFCYQSNNHFRPGLVSHYLTVLANKNKKMISYNFLAGSSQYKQSLSTDNDRLKTLIISRKTMKAHIEHLLRATVKNNL